MEAVNAWVGGTTPQGARVVAKVDGAATDARLAVADNDELTSPTFFGPESPDQFDTVRFTATGLDADTVYWWAVEVDSVLPTEPDGRFRTFPTVGGQADFTMWAGTCAGQTGTGATGNELAQDRISNGAVFDAILAEHGGSLFGWHGGDIHYYDLGSGFHGIPDDATVEQYVRGFDDVLLQPKQHVLYREIPIFYSWDDHDYGPNDSDRTHFGRESAQDAYRIKVPHPDLPDANGGTYYSFVVGRVLFVASDVRSFRDPNTTPHSAAKTMLGTAQRAWMQDLLSTTDAELFVWLVPDRAWHIDAVGSGSSADHWGNFPDERSQLVDMFDELGWLNRMIYIGGDAHHLGMDSGASNPYGGFPVYQWASLDSTPSSPDASLWDRGSLGGQRGIYGTLRCNDTGDAIEVTATGWLMDVAQVFHTFSITIETEPEPEPEPEPLPPLEQVAQARISTRLTWLSCNLSDGVLIEELPDLVGEEVSRIIGEYTSANLSLPIPSMDVPNTIPADERLAAQALLAAKATEPRRTMIVCVVNDVPTYAGIPLPRDLGTDAAIPLGLVSLEGYLRHRFIGDHTYNEQDVALIADGILRDAGDTDDGQGIGLIIDAPNTGVIASREYLDIDDQPVYDGLSELMDAGLIEWTIDVDWRDGFAYRIVDKIARVRGRLGRSGAPQTIFQSATFSSEGGSSASYLLKEDYSGDGYANVVRLSGAGEGVDQPRSAPAIDQAQLDSGVPVWELRDSAPQTVTQQALLDLHAERLLDRVRSGARTLEIVARWDAPGARYGVDWSMGDDVGHELKGHAHPGGLNGARRAIGFALSIQRGTIRPILQEDL